VHVQLSPIEFLHAAHAGFLRQVQAVLRGRRHAHGFTGDGWAAHVLGALGEFVVAKGLDIFWCGPGRVRQVDVGPFEVRTCTSERHRLILHESDSDDSVFILVQQVTPCEWLIVGWIRGRDGKAPRFWTDPGTGRPAFFIPRECLRQDFPPRVTADARAPTLDGVK
jgi:hypothetical protein